MGESSGIVFFMVEQFPCNYDVGEYKVQLVKDDFETNAPAFISYLPSSPKLWYQTYDHADVGSYTIRVSGGLIRRGKVIDRVYTDFILDVLPVIKSVSPT